MEYRANIQRDVVNLSERIQNLNLDQQKWLNGNVILRGLMTEEMLDERLRALLEHPWNLSQEDVDKSVMLGCLMEPAETVNQRRDQLIEHLVNGKDHSDEPTVGGFNQSELDALVHLIDIAERSFVD